MNSELSSGSERMTQILQDYFDVLNKKYADHLSGMLGLSFVSCDVKSLSLCVSMEPKPWMCNTRGALHGGILATALDVCLGALCRYVSGWVECPTVQLRVDYHLPVPAGRLLLIEAQLESAHPPMYSATGWICVEGKPQHRLVTAAASFYASASHDRCL